MNIPHQINHTFFFNSLFILFSYKKNPIRLPLVHSIARNIVRIQQIKFRDKFFCVLKQEKVEHISSDFNCQIVYLYPSQSTNINRQHGSKLFSRWGLLTEGYWVCQGREGGPRHILGNFTTIQLYVNVRNSNFPGGADPPPL